MRLLLLALVAMLAGCATSTESAVISVQGEGDARSYHVEFDASQPNLGLYEDAKCARTQAFTVHDLLLAWDHEVELEFFDASFGCGFTLCAIGGFPAAEVDGETRGCFERGGYWSVFLNGEMATVGISELAVVNGDQVAFIWEAF